MTSRGTLLVGAWALAIAVVASVSGLDRADQEAILGGNAARLLGLSDPQSISTEP